MDNGIVKSCGKLSKLGIIFVFTLAPIIFTDTDYTGCSNNQLGYEYGQVVGVVVGVLIEYARGVNEAEKLYA